METIKNKAKQKSKTESELLQMQAKVREADITAKYNALKASEEAASLREAFNLSDLSSSADRVVDRRNSYRDSLINAPVFIDKKFTVPLVMDQLYLIGALPKHGKSTFSANISYPIYKQGRKVLVISNEEDTADVLARIACIDLNMNINKEKMGFMSIEESNLIDEKIKDVGRYIDVVGKDTGHTYTIEGVKNILNQAKGKDYAAIIIDYYQNVNSSTTNPGVEDWKVQQQLKDFLEVFIKTSKIPVVLFAQLYPTKSESASFFSRIQGRRSIFNAATAIFELIKEKETETTILVPIDARWCDDVDAFYFMFEKGKLKLSSESDYEAKAERLEKLANKGDDADEQ